MIVQLSILSLSLISALAIPITNAQTQFYNLPIDTEQPSADKYWPKQNNGKVKNESGQIDAAKAHCSVNNSRQKADNIAKNPTSTLRVPYWSVNGLKPVTAVNGRKHVTHLYDCGVIRSDSLLPKSPTFTNCCATAQIQIAQAITKDSAYWKGINNVNNAAARDGKEHGVSFKLQSNGPLTVTPVQQGEHMFIDAKITPNTVASLHNHTGPMPPSAGDVYSLIEANAIHSLYTTKFVVTPDGTNYAIAVTDAVAAQNFTLKYPKSEKKGFNPQFTESKVDGYSLFDEYQYAVIYFQGENYSKLEANEAALAYILDSFNSGVALLKMDTDGRFSKINTKKTGGEGTQSIFSTSKCQH